MLVKFVTEFATPVRPHGDDVEVVFDPASEEVVEARYVHNEAPVLGRKLKVLRARIGSALEVFGGWEKFRTRAIRVAL